MSTIALNGIPELHSNPATKSAGLRWYAVIAASALHLAVLLWLFGPWRGAAEHVPQLTLPVTLVFEPPAEPKPQSKPQSQPQVGPEQQKAREPDWDRSSGPDEKTTAPPPAEADKVKTEDKPTQAMPVPAPQGDVAVSPPPPAPAIIAEPPTPPQPRPEPSRPAARPKDDNPVPHPQTNATAALHPRTLPSHVEPGERPTAGDPWLNAAMAEFEKHRFYPPLARPLGLVGVAGFTLEIDRTGKIIGLRLEKSSGAELLDRAAEKMIRDTAQIPPPPADIRGDPVSIWVGLYIAPR